MPFHPIHNPMTATPPLKLRLISWWWDYLLIVAWLTVVFVLIGIP